MENYNNSEYVRLKELGKSKFEVAKNESDIRDWTVKNSEGRILGKVSDLLFDTQSEKVLYMVLDLDGNEMYLKERKVVVPLDIAQIQTPFKNVILPGILANELTSLPTYEAGKVNTLVEDLVHHVFGGSNKSESREIHPSEVTQAQPLADASTQKTVVAVFEHINQCQNVIEYLLEHDFKRDQISLSSRDIEYNRVSKKADDEGVTNWFRSIFGNDNDAKVYSDAAKTGCVITVQTSSLAEAERTANILDRHGALSINDTLSTDHSEYKSRILNKMDPHL